MKALTFGYLYMKQIPKVINQPKPTIHVKAWFIQSAKLRKSDALAYFIILKLAYAMLK